MTTTEKRAPYDVQTARFTGKPRHDGARNMSGEKEEIDRKVVIVFDRKHRDMSNVDLHGVPYSSGFRQVVDARWYMGRSSHASVVYCSVWIRTRDGESYTGTGSAGGCGYHKESAALDEALSAAGVTLGASVSGCGDGPSRLALIAVARAAGYRQTPLDVI